MKEFINISIQLSKRFVLNVQNHLRQLEGLNLFVRTNAKTKDELEQGRKHLLIAKSVALCLGQSTTYLLSIVLRVALMRTEKEQKNTSQHQKQKEPLDFLNITLIRGILFVLKYAKNVAQTKKESKERISITLKNCVSDGCVNRATYDGIKSIQKKVRSLFLFEKYTGQKALLLN